MTRKPSAAGLRQRRGQSRRNIMAALELQAPAGVGGAAPRARARGDTTARSPNASTREWRRLQAAKLKANPECELRLPDCEGAAVEVDHIRPLAEGGPRFEWSNLRSVCESCHLRRHGKRKLHGKGKPRGFDVDGNPLDPAHRWNTGR